MELNSFERDRQEVSRLRSVLMAKQQHGLARRRSRLVIVFLVATVGTTLIMGVFNFRRARLQQFVEQARQATAEWAGAVRGDPSPQQAPGAGPRLQRAHPRRTTRRVEPVSVITRIEVSAAPVPSDFVEVVDSTNLHYLVRYTAAPIVRLPADGSPAVPNFAIARATREIRLSEQGPGSAGVVVLRGIVGKDGTVKDLSVISGPPDLTPPAVEAAKRWRYIPEYINGQPMERRVQITVDFTVRLNPWISPSIMASR